jgi:hypothetical protein
VLRKVGPLWFTKPSGHGGRQGTGELERRREGISTAPKDTFRDTFAQVVVHLRRGTNHTALVNPELRVRRGTSSIRCDRESADPADVGRPEGALPASGYLDGGAVAEVAAWPVRTSSRVRRHQDLVAAESFNEGLDG